jgi:hypothetical protein
VARGRRATGRTRGELGNSERSKRRHIPRPFGGPAGYENRIGTLPPGKSISCCKAKYAGVLSAPARHTRLSPLKSGDVVFAPSGHFHYFENTSDTEDLLILIVLNSSAKAEPPMDGSNKRSKHNRWAPPEAVAACSVNLGVGTVHSDVSRKRAICRASASVTSISGIAVPGL